MIAQHHEHLSGSGCPSRPQREEICLGAGIIAVTDTVKACRTAPRWGEAAVGETVKGAGGSSTRRSWTSAWLLSTVAGYASERFGVVSVCGHKGSGVAHIVLQPGQGSAEGAGTGPRRSSAHERDDCLRQKWSGEEEP